MKKSAIIFIILVLLGCSKIKKETFEFTKLQLVNKASYYFKGYPDRYIENQKEIDYVFGLINRLTDDYSDSVLISVNYSYVEVLLVDENSNKEEFFSVIFTKHNGDVIRYGGKNYYYNQELVNFIKDKLNMSDKPLLDHIKNR